ncbi:hypothetical protein Agabi119p4_5631 [Agaricus bisporus var. burnettii]|uniref:Nephrocystin 3-like N-terminal domain-containing protein n=1 Tax=Agaricus bisporus var. burnettii TaxID=192524 RepID=A0A8H7F243_AGABI|nr:hypothetical protein Agabi119p4_5631 [Agaricus bisporus var. burnettii]
MPPKSFATRSSRCSPYSDRSSAAASLDDSLVPEQHHSILSGRHAASHLSSPSVYHQPSASSILPYSSINIPVPPRQNPQLTYALQPSPSTPQLEHSTHHTHPFSQAPTRLTQLPFPHGPYHPPTTDIPYPNPIHPPHNSRPLGSSLNADRPEDSTYQNYSVHQQLESLQVPQERPMVFPGSRHSLSTRYESRGMFSGSHNLAFSDNTFIDNSITSDNFMKDLLQHTIIGVEFDSSDRHPPPRCHPGTRLAIIERCQMFIAQCNGKEKIHWVVGAAGVGKSAVMQIVAEETPADASVFFSVNGRQDGTKLITTIAYQLAAKYEPYRQFIRIEISRDPSLLRKSLPVQFRKFIVDPFIHRCLLNSSQ